MFTTKFTKSTKQSALIIPFSLFASFALFVVISSLSHHVLTCFNLPRFTSPANSSPLHGASTVCCE